ncbi:MAG: hypothetical protein SF187_30955 [Deltaproteobacteria bacterium]|nr:hypothetical protein [Deltaproteobacteria bacterium]
MRLLAIAAASCLLGCEASPTVLGVGATAPPLCTWAFTFEGGAQSWVAAPLVEGALNPWQHGASLDPACHDGTQCFGASLAEGYPGCSAAVLVSPEVDLVGCSGAATLSFWHWRDFNNPGDATSPPDGGFLQISFDAGLSWTDLASPSRDPYNGQLAADPKKCSAPEIVGSYIGHAAWGSRNRGWLNPQFTLPALFATKPFWVRFVFGSSGNRDARGWIVDDVRITTIP